VTQAIEDFAPLKPENGQFELLFAHWAHQVWRRVR
jgi:hypothetical protein